MTVLSLHPLYTFTWSSLMAKELEEVDVDTPLMFGSHLAEKSRKKDWEGFRHIFNNMMSTDSKLGSATSYTCVKEPSRAILSECGARSKGTRHFPGQSCTLQNSYFPFAISTWYFETEVWPSKIMLDSELSAASSVGSGNCLDQEPAAEHSCSHLTASCLGESFPQCSATT